MSWALRKQKAKPAAEKQLNLGRGQQSSSNTRCQEVTPRPAAPQRFHSPHSTKTEIYFHFGGGRSSAQLGYETQPGPSLKAAGGGFLHPQNCKISLGEVTTQLLHRNLEHLLPRGAQHPLGKPPQATASPPPHPKLFLSA